MAGTDYQRFEGSQRFFNVSFFTFGAVVLIIFCTSKYWETKPVIDWDITQYYSYLPATFIYQDYAFSDPDTLWQQAHLKFTPIADGSGIQPVKMTYGVATLYAPFFLAAHTYSKNSSDFSPNGFSIPYKFALLLSSLTFALIGLWFFGRWLLNFFSPLVSLSTTVVLFAGTNLAYYTLVEPMSHVYGFALFSILLFFINKYLKGQKTWMAITFGFITGFLVLIRLTNLILLIFPALLLYINLKTLNRKAFLKHLLIVILIGVIVWVPQFVYWKHMTGKLLFYSYNEEGFFFSDPEIWKGLFSYRKGWFVYSPLLFLTIPGFILLFLKNKKLTLASGITLVTGLWVTFSWWCWWYGGGLGARAMIEYLPIMGLTIAMLFQTVLKRGSYCRYSHLCDCHYAMHHFRAPYHTLYEESYSSG